MKQCHVEWRRRRTLCMSEWMIGKKRSFRIISKFPTASGSLIMHWCHATSWNEEIRRRSPLIKETFFPPGRVKKNSSFLPSVKCIRNAVFQEWTKCKRVKWVRSTNMHAAVKRMIETPPLTLLAKFDRWSNGACWTLLSEIFNVRTERNRRSSVNIDLITRYMLYVVSYTLCTWYLHWGEWNGHPVTSL